MLFLLLSQAIEPWYTSHTMKEEKAATRGSGHAIHKDEQKGTINFRIEGGHELGGEITVRTSKNGAVGVLCASLLTRRPTIIKNAPRIEEVFRIIEVLQSIGVTIKWVEHAPTEKHAPSRAADGNTGIDLMIIPPRDEDGLRLDAIDYTSASRTRSCIMLIGSLIHSSHSFRIPQAGGCKLGGRTVKPHFYALEKLGVHIKTTSTYYEVTHKKLKPAEVILYESGDTLTENALIAAALIPGVTTIKYASANYQVQDVCFYLQELGVRIDGIGTSTLVVHGISPDEANAKAHDLESPITYYLSEDPIEAMSLITAAIVTKSTLIVRRCPIDFLEVELLKLEKMGLKYKIISRYKALNSHTNLVDIKVMPSKLTALEEKIEAQPYPWLNIDNLPFFAVIATQAKGETFIHDWVYEERAIYYRELNKLGAETLLADPHRIYIKGPTVLKAADVICPPALRPSVILLIGMLAAHGTSILRNVYNINRGYEDLAERLNSVGARIETFRD
jgi:UDP-N-acetylglucosamine 1-carboxyvinyltransferase